LPGKPGVSFAREAWRRARIEGAEIYGAAGKSQQIAQWFWWRLAALSLLAQVGIVPHSPESTWEP
jgi:hypothetical protein